MTHSKSVIFVGLLSGLLLNCGGKATPEPESAPPPAEPAAEAPPPAEAPAAAAEAPKEEEKKEAAPPAEPAPEKLSDEQIAMFTTNANTAEIDQAKLAQKKAKNAKVKKFAAMMIADHTKAKNKGDALVKKLKITPAESATASMVKTDSDRAIESLKNAAAGDFDKAYIEGQIEAHKKVLEAFDKQVLPNVQNADLKKDLEEFKPKIEAHLKEAQDIQAALAAEPAPEAKPTAEKASAGSAGGTAAPAKK